MNCEDIWVGIIIPLISALIGGAVTFLGVKMTINHENKKTLTEEKLKYKPYLKLSSIGGGETIECKERIKDTFDQDNIDFDKVKRFYAYVINDIKIKNSSNSECILRSVIIDGAEYLLKERLLLKDEVANLITTRTTYVNSKNLLKSIVISASDVLGNIYYYKCEFEKEFDKLSTRVEYENGKSLSVPMVQYKITSIGLPVSKL